MFNTAKKLISQKYKVTYINDSKLPKTFICPDCLNRIKQITDNVILQQLAAKNVVIGQKGKKVIKKLAICSKCDFTKTN